MTDEYPGANPWTDRHGSVRWRFRRSGKVVYLPGAPGQPAFEEAFRALIRGDQRRADAAISTIPTAASPRSLRAAWRKYIAENLDWMTSSDLTKQRDSAIAERFLQEPIEKGEPDTWGEMPIADLKRRHLNKIIAGMRTTPHAARRRLIVMRKMILAALDEEWIETDPSYRLKYRPKTTKGWRAWSWDEMQAFEERWPLGTTPRTCYALALWLGPRRKDVARLRPEEIDDDTLTFTASKNNRIVAGYITPMLREVLNAIDLSGPTILKTAFGKQFSEKSLTGRMADWTRSAGLPPGCTLHGLRKTLGSLITDAGGSTRQAMGALGHDDIKQAELYSDGADRRLAAREALTKVVDFVAAKKARKSAG